jgi:hypothetical protein
MKSKDLIKILKKDLEQEVLINNNNFAHKIKDCYDLKVQKRDYNNTIVTEEYFIIEFNYKQLKKI